ncbi:MAG: carbon-nitrogen hydrolase family protein, partial [Nitrospira sp.]
MADIRLRIAFLHLAPIPGALAKNRHLIAHAITKAACLGAAWIITPELAVSGYTFADTLGTDWIAPQPDPWMEKVRLFAARKRVAIFLSHPERDPQSGRLYNTVFAITPDGRLAGSHRKINALRVGSEAWSTPGTETTVFPMEPLGNVGMLICADAFSPGIANSL